MIQIIPLGKPITCPICGVNVARWLVDVACIDRFGCCAVCLETELDPGLWLDQEGVEAAGFSRKLEMISDFITG